MEIAVIYKDGKRVFVSFNEEKFKLLLQKYFNEYGDVMMAFDNIVADLKRETQTK